jgi:hypothetical protein
MPYRVSDAMFIMGFILFVCAILISSKTVQFPPPQFEYDITTIRAAQRECLKREPSHSFSLVQTQGGYMVQCELIRKTE